jgi:hypothetical protein
LFEGEVLVLYIILFSDHQENLVIPGVGEHEKGRNTDCSVVIPDEAGINWPLIQEPLTRT